MNSYKAQDKEGNLGLSFVIQDTVGDVLAGVEEDVSWGLFSRIWGASLMAGLFCGTKFAQVRCCRMVDISAVCGMEILGRVARAYGSFAAKLVAGSTASFAAVVATREPVEPQIRNDRLYLRGQENIAWLEASMHKFLFMDVG
ncbi:hypothetical protein Ancab_028334 [Ancistrocladus abbreviatus]